MSPAAADVKEKESGQKNCVSSINFFSSISVDSQVGKTYSNRALWRGKMCLVRFKVPLGMGLLLYFLCCGGNSSNESRGPHNSDSRVVRSGIGDWRRVMTSLIRVGASSSTAVIAHQNTACLVSCFTPVWFWIVPWRYYNQVSTCGTRVFKPLFESTKRWDNNHATNGSVTLGVWMIHYKWHSNTIQETRYSLSLEKGRGKTRPHCQWCERLLSSM